MRRELVAWGLAGACAVCAAEPADLKVDASGSASFGQWSGNRNLDDQGSSAVVNVEERIKLDAGGFRLEGDVLFHTRDRESSFTGDVREAFGQFRTEDLVVRVGRQIINWGQADLINPTQRFATENYRLRATQPGLRQGGVDAIRVLQTFDTVTADLVFASFRKGSAIPVGPLQAAGLTVDERGEGANSSVGVRLSGSTGPNDYSVSYFRGRDVMPTYQVGAGFVAQPLYPELSVWGADYSFNAGDYSIKLEGAYSQNVDRSRVVLPLDQFLWVGGVERRFGDYTLSVQYMQKQVKDFDPSLLANPIAQFNLSAADQLRSSPRNLLVRSTKVLEDLGGSFTVVLRKSLNDSSGAVFLLAEKNILEGVTLTVGLDRFWGALNTYTGALKKNDVVFLAIRFSY